MTDTIPPDEEPEPEPEPTEEEKTSLLDKLKDIVAPDDDPGGAIPPGMR